MTKLSLIALCFNYEQKTTTYKLIDQTNCPIRMATRTVETSFFFCKLIKFIE